MREKLELDGTRTVFEVEIVRHEHRESHEDECGRSNMRYTVKTMEGEIEVLTPFGKIWCGYNLRGESDGPEGSSNWGCSAPEAEGLVDELQDCSPVDYGGDPRFWLLERCTKEVEPLLKMAAEPATDEEADEAVEMFERASATLRGRRVEGRVGRSLEQELWRSGRFLRQASLARHPKVVEAHARAVERTREQGRALLSFLPKPDRARKALETLARSVKPAAAQVSKREFLARMGRAWDEARDRGWVKKNAKHVQEA